MENGEISSSYGEDIAETTLQEIRAMGYLASDLVVSTLADCYFMLTSQDLSSNYVYQILSDVANATPISSDSSIDALLVSGSNVYIGLSTDTDQMVIKVTITYSVYIGASVTQNWVKSIVPTGLLSVSTANYPTDFALGTFDISILYVMSSF